MGIVFEQSDPQPRDPISLGAGEPAPIKAPGPLDVVTAAFRNTNAVVGAYEAMRKPHFERDPNYNPLNTIKGTKYFERYAERFMGDRNLDETQQRMARIDAEERDQQILASAGAAGVVASIGAGLLDPTIFLPAGNVYRSVRGGNDILRTARSFMLGGASQAILSEAALQASHETHGFGDALFSVGSAALLGGLLGAGVAKLSRAELQGLTKGLDREREILGEHLTNGVRAEADSPPIAPVRDSGVTTPLERSVGAAETDTRALNVASYGLDKVPVVRDVVKRLFPDLRTYQSTGTQAKRAMADLAETALLFDENRLGKATTLEGGPALDRNARMFSDGFRTQFSDEMTRLWSEVKYGNAEQSFPHLREFVGNLTGKSNGLTYDQFKKLVFDAINNGDKHEIPQVQAAAQYLRKNLFDIWGERAEKSIPEFRAFQPKEGESYAPHMPDKDKINANRPEAVEDVTRWYAAQQEQKRAAQTRIASINEQLKAAQERLRKAELKLEGLADREQVIDARKRETELVPDAGKRPDVLGERQQQAAIRRAELEAEVAEASQLLDNLRTRIEAEILAWEGKSAKSAQTALKSRKAKEDAGGGANGRLTSADADVEQAVKRIVASDRDLSLDELRARAEETIDRWIGGPDGRLPYEVSVGYSERGPIANNDLRGSLAEREFHLPYDIKKKWLIDDVEHVVSGYLRSVVPDVLLAERFGDLRMTEVFRKHAEEYAALIDAAKGPKERMELSKERDRVTADLAAVRDRIRGVYGFSADTQMRNAARVASGAKRVNNLLSGGMMAVSSLPDIAGIVFRHGIESAFGDGWQPFFKAMTDKETWEAAKKFSKEWRAVGIGVETAVASRQRSIDDLTELYRSQSRFERGLEFVTDKYFVANLLAPFTDLQKSVAANVASANILRAAKAASEGKATAKQLRLLGESNINPSLASKIWAEFEKGGEVIDGIYVPNTADWTAADARRAFQGAVARDVDIAVITPGQEKPLWLSNPVLGVLGQFKTFMASSTQRIMIANLQRHDAAALQGLVFSVGLGMLAYRIHTLAAGTPVSDRPQDWIKEGLSRSGVLGWLEEGNSIASKGTRGAVDIYRLIGADKPLSRYANRNAADLVLGPTWGKIQNLLKVTGSLGAGEWGASDTHAVRLLMATQNLLYTRMLFDQAEKGFNNAFGIPVQPQ